MVNKNWRNDGKSKLDSRTYRAHFLAVCNKAKKERSSNMSQDSGNDCEPSHKKQRSVDLETQVTTTRDVHNDVSEHIQQLDEAHKKRMLKLKQKQYVEILEYFRTKIKRKESLDKMYQLEKDLICEQCGESLSKVDKLKQLDEDFKIKFEGFRHEMDKCWKDLNAEHLTERANEEEMRLKNIKLLQSAISTLEDGEIFEGLCHEMENFEGTTLHEDSDVTKIDAPSTSIDSGNPNASILESESAINILEDGETHTSPTIISSPVPLLQELRERLNMANDNVEISPHRSPKEDLTAIPVDPDKQINKSTVPFILGEPVISSSSSVKEVNLKNEENQLSQALLPSSVLITDSESLKESGQSTSNGFVVVGSDDKQIYLRSVPLPVDETAFPISSSIKQLDVLSIPVTPDNINASDCSPPLLESSLGKRGPIDGMQSSEELAISSDTIHDNSCKEKSIICLDSDDEQIHESSAAIPVNELIGACNLSMEALGLSSEQPNHFSIGCSRNEPAASLSSKENQNKEVQRMLGGVSIGGSSSCEALQSGGQSSMNLDTAVRELMQQTQGNALFSILQQQCMDQSCQLPLKQLLPTQFPSSEIRVTDESLPSSSCQYVTNNHLMMHPMTRVVGGNAQTPLSDTTTNYYVNHSMNSYVTRLNSYQPPSFDPLQNELAEINKAGYAAKKNYEDMVAQLVIDREKEVAQISQKYSLLFQEAENDVRQKRKELDLHYEKTNAHILLAEAWTQAFDVNSPTFHPSTQFQSTGMQTNAVALSPRLVNQFSDLISTNQIVGPQYPCPYQNLFNSEPGWGSYLPNPHIYPSLPTPSIPSQSNQHPLNFSSPGSSAGYYSHFDS